MSPRSISRLLLLGAALLVPSSAFAVGGTSTDFRVSPSANDGAGAFQLVHPATGGRGAGFLGANFTTGEYFAAPVGDRRQSALHMGGGFAIADWLRFEADLPYMTAITGNDGLTTNGLGDAQISATIPIVFPGTAGFGIGIVPFADIPTMEASSSDNFQMGGAFIIGSGDGGLGWRGNATIRSDSTGTSEMTLGIGGNAQMGRYFVGGLEVLNSRAAGPRRDDAVTTRNPVEATFYGVLGQERPASFTMGFTTGFFGDAGSPMYRVTMGLSLKRAGLVGDPDNDGIFGLADDCPSTPEDMDGHLDVDGCPEPDDDNDGVADVIDRCPAEAEDRDGHEDRDGCPDIDNDFDGIYDTVDLCPDEAGIMAAEGCPDQDGDTVPDPKDECVSRPGSPEAAGCPDYDHDRVPDFRDLCPTEPISPKIDPVRSNGCPTRAYYSGGRIEITERVNFETGKATITSDSYSVLRDVARALNSNPDIRMVEIGGHTDNIGGPVINARLSKERAKSVRSYLITQGVSPDRLSFHGYGETRPIDSNETEAGRAQNRRVEFVVIETVSGSRR